MTGSELRQVLKAHRRPWLEFACLVGRTPRTITEWLASLAQPRKPIDVAALRAVIDTMSKSSVENGVRAMRDEARY